MVERKEETVIMGGLQMTDCELQRAQAGGGGEEGTCRSGERERKLLRASSSRSRVGRACMDLAIATYSHEAMYCFFTDASPWSKLLSLPNRY